MENIGMQDSLLSRFDLLFIMLDKHNQENDEAIADHVLKLHRYRTPGEPDGTVLEMAATLESLSTEDPNEVDSDLVDTPMYERNDAWLPKRDRFSILWHFFNPRLLECTFF